MNSNLCTWKIELITTEKNQINFLFTLKSGKHKVIKKDLG